MKFGASERGDWPGIDTIKVSSFMTIPQPAIASECLLWIIDYQ